MVRITGEIGEPPNRLLDLWRLDALRGIELLPDGSLVIGALSTWTDLRRSPLVLRHLPVLAAAAATIGAVQIQNRGTIGGNIVNASPAGDSLPVLLAADATHRAGQRSWRADGRGGRLLDGLPDDGPRTGRAGPPRHACRCLPDRRMGFRKVGTRRAQAISKVVMAVAWRPDDRVWRDVRVALGSDRGHARARAGRRGRAGGRARGRGDGRRGGGRDHRRASRPSTMSGRPPTIGARSPDASSTACCATRAAGRSSVPERS